MPALLTPALSKGIEAGIETHPIVRLMEDPTVDTTDLIKDPVPHFEESDHGLVRKFHQLFPIIQSMAICMSQRASLRVMWDDRVKN